MPFERSKLVCHSLTVLVAGEGGRLGCVREIVSAEIAPAAPRPDHRREPSYRRWLTRGC